MADLHNDSFDFKSFDVLVVDDEPDNLDAFRFAFRKAFRLHYARGAEEALSQLAALDAAVVVADQRMPAMSGIELLAEVKRRNPDCYAVLLTAYAELDVLVDAVNSGAVDRYVQKPWDSKEFGAVLRQGIRSFATLRENRRLREQLAQYAGYLEREQRDPLDFGALAAAPEGSASHRLLELINEIAPSDTPVLIEGEEGLEKDVVARAVHVASRREDRPFVAVTCGAFPGPMLERELFGWGRGAFEGAFQERAGRVELADGGTLWIDEPGALPPSLQARMVRLLTVGEIERVGDPVVRRVDVRLVVSATPSLSQASASVPLLPELAARLGVFPIRLVPLRERRQEIRPLAEHFLRKHAQRNPRATTRMTAEAIARLSDYRWPGNVRELETVIERAAILARGEPIGPEHLSFGPPSSAPSRRKRERSRGDGLSLDHRLDAIERRELLHALEANRGNKAEVARALGIHRTTLYYRLKKHGIDV